MTIKNALLSVSDKTGLLPFAKFLAAQGVELLSTGGTAQLLRDNAIPVRDVSDATNFPEMMDGRVKTLHPVVHGGLLARRAEASHMAAATEHNIGMIDLLIVNLYPFEATLHKTRDPEQLIENIDIGGPAMIRSAAKNHESVTVIVDVADYKTVQQSMQQNTGATTLELRQRLAAKAHADEIAVLCLMMLANASATSRKSLVQSFERQGQRVAASVCHRPCNSIPLVGRSSCARRSPARP